MPDFSFEAARIVDAVQYATEAMARPHVLMRPALSADGSQWCALYGTNLQDGVAGFGETPVQAMEAFDHAWRNARLPKAERRADGR